MGNPNVVIISRAQALERLAEIDAILDMLDTYDEETLLIERGGLTFMLGE